MKILFSPASMEISDTHNYSKGCIAGIFYNLLDSLSKLEVESYILSKGIDIENPLQKNIKLFTLGESRIKNPSYVHSKIFLKSLIYTNKILKKEKIDLITQLYFFYGVSFNPMLKTIKNYPFVIGMCELPHPLLDDELEGLSKFRTLKTFGKTVLSPLFKKTIDHCDILIAVNEGAKDLYSQVMPRSKIRVIPYGVDLTHFKQSPHPKSHNILAVSRLIERRGLDYLVEAMPSILKEYPDTKLHFVGNGPRKEILQKKAKDLGIGSNLIFYGNVTADELINHYKNCSVFCHLSSADGWNQPALEAMASGRPVICTDAPHNSMVIDKKTGFLVPFGDYDAVANAILKLFSDDELACKMGAEGRKKAEKDHDWAKIGEKYYNVYREVV